MCRSCARASQCSKPFTVTVWGATHAAQSAHTSYTISSTSYTFALNICLSILWKVNTSATNTTQA